MRTLLFGVILIVILYSFVDCKENPKGKLNAKPNQAGGFHQSEANEVSSKPTTGETQTTSRKKEETDSALKIKLIEQWTKNKESKDVYEKFIKNELERLETAEIQTSEENGAKYSHSAYISCYELFEAGKIGEYISALKKQSDNGNRKALYNLGRLYEFGEFVDRDFAKASRYYKRAADLGDPQAQRSFAFMLDHGRTVPKNTGKAMLYYTFAADNYDTEASLVLGNKFQRGYDTSKSCTSAIRYYKHAARQVIEEYMKTPYLHTLQFQLVSLPNRANGIDEEKVSNSDILDYVKFNANPDNPSTLVEIGMLYLFGHYGQEIDFAVAKDYFEQVAEQEPKASAMLGRIYEFGLGVEADALKAKELYSHAVEKNNIQGILFLGELYLTGNGIEKDFTKAYDLFVKAAKLGVPEAHLNLGIIYLEGYGVKADFEKAASYFKGVLVNNLSTTAARAEYYLAEMLNYGIGMKSDCNAALRKYKSVTDKGKRVKDIEIAQNAYEEGNTELALIHYEKLAELGIGLAQANAAWIYDEFHKDGIPSSNFGVSLDLALKFYSRAADQGNEYAHLRLGDYYYYGYGNLSVDYAKSASYYRYIGNHHPQAHFNLGYMHQYGEGVKKDLYLAKRYYDNTLRMQPDSFLSVYICLINIGIEYSMQLYSEGKTEQLLNDFFDYFIPSAYYEFYEDFQKDWLAEEEELTESSPSGSTISSSKSKTKGETVGFLDSESVFGYNWDTVLIFSIGTVLCITLLFRFGIIQIQIV